MVTLLLLRTFTTHSNPFKILRVSSKTYLGVAAGGWTAERPGVGSELRKRPQGKVLRRTGQNCRRDISLKSKEEKISRRKWTSVTKTTEKTKKTGGSPEQGNQALLWPWPESKT